MPSSTPAPHPASTLVCPLTHPPTHPPTAMPTLLGLILNRLTQTIGIKASSTSSSSTFTSATYGKKRLTLALLECFASCLYYNPGLTLTVSRWVGGWIEEI